MADESVDLTVSLLSDDPLFSGGNGFDPSEDAFNHESYARAIFSILKKSRPPLSIGLFGHWGIGKSTVVHILSDIIRKDSSAAPSLKWIYFNAWKYSGDSFRRQLLIEVAKQVYEGEEDYPQKILRLEQLNYTDVLREPTPEGGVTGIKNALIEAANTRVELRQSGVVRIYFAIGIILVTAVVAYLAQAPSIFTNGIFLAILALFLKVKFNDLFIVHETPVTDPKLIFPEQFEHEFRKLIDARGPLGDKHAVIIIDDIDRCEPPLVRDILVSIKSFLGHPNCFIIVPCDEQAVVDVFNEPNQQKGYSEESLRKYFNVTIRMSPLVNTDLVDFANSVATKTKIPPEVIQMAVLANCKDARKMKHFLNSFLVKYQIAKERERNGFLPINIDTNIAGFAKVVLLETLYPELFERIVRQPQIYNALERSREGSPQPILLRSGLSEWQLNYPGLDGILDRTKQITIERIDILFALKATNVQARVPRSIELEEAVVSGDSALIDEIINDIPSDRRSDLADLLVALLSRSDQQFLRNSIATCLRLYAKDEFDDLRNRIGKAAIEQLLNPEKATKALQQNAGLALQCASDQGQETLETTLSKYSAELGEVSAPNPDLAEPINAFYRFSKTVAPMSQTLNRKFEDWTQMQLGLSLIARLGAPELPPNDSIPSAAVLQKIASGVSTNENAVEMNILRRQVLSKYWNDNIAPILASQLNEIFTEAASEAGYSPREQFVIETIVSESRCIEQTRGDELWSAVEQLYAAVSDRKARLDIMKAAVVFATASVALAAKAAAAGFIVEQWKNLTDEEVRTLLAYLESFDDPQHRELLQKVVAQDLELAESERSEPSDRTVERFRLATDYTEHLPADWLEKFLLASLRVNDTAFDVWEPVIFEFADKSDSLATAVAEELTVRVAKPLSQERRSKSLELFVRLLPDANESSKPDLLQKFFALLEDTDQDVRTVSAPFISKVRASVNKLDFANRVNSLVRNICDVSPADIDSFRTELNETLRQKDLFGEHEWNDLAALIKRLILHQDEHIQAYALDLLDQMPEEQLSLHEDVTREVQNLANGESVHKDRASNILSEIRKEPRD